MLQRLFDINLDISHRKVLVDDAMLVMIFVAMVDLSSLIAFRLLFQFQSDNKKEYLKYRVCECATKLN